MIRIKTIVVLLFMFCGFKSFSQDSSVKWAAEIGGSFIDFTNVAGFPGEDLNFRITNLGLVRYINKGISLGVYGSYSGNNNFKENESDIIMMDFFAMYDFGFTDEKWVPQILLGGGRLVKNSSDRSNSVNVGIGLVNWFSPRVGLNSQIIYRSVAEKPEEVFGSHTQFSMNLIITFGESKVKRNKRRTGSGLTKNN